MSVWLHHSFFALVLRTLFHFLTQLHSSPEFPFAPSDFLFLLACNDAFSLSVLVLSFYLPGSDWCVWREEGMVGRGRNISMLSIINESSLFQFKRLINTTNTSQCIVDNLSVSLVFLMIRNLLRQICFCTYTEQNYSRFCLYADDLLIYFHNVKL